MQRVKQAKGHPGGGLSASGATLAARRAPCCAAVCGSGGALVPDMTLWGLTSLSVSAVYYQHTPH